MSLSSKTEVARAELIEEFAQILGRLKRQVTAALPASVQDQMAGVTPHQLDGLALLDKEPDGLTMNELARGQGCALSSATALIDRLEKQGLVERRDDPQDRRVVRIVTTTEGRRFIACAKEGKRDVATKLLEPLKDSEIQQLVTLLTKITEGDA